MINKNLLEVCLSPNFGGLELYMGKCSKEFEKDFNVFKLISKNSKLEEYLEKDNHTFILKKKSSFSLINALKLAKIIDTNLIDIIHLHWTKDIPIIVLGKKLSKRKPKVIQSRHMTMTRFKNDFYHRFLYKNIDIIIAVTKEVEKQLIKFIPEDIRPKIKQIYLGAQCPSFYENNIIDEYRESLQLNETFMIGFVGRINEFKGQYLLIEAINILKKKNLNIKAFFVGYPMKESYLDELYQKVKEYNIEDNIEFLGFINEPHKFMQACDCMVMASRNETFGLVTIEAMKMGTVVIGADSGGVLEIIDDEKNGLYFENRNYISLSEKIEIIYENKKLRNNLSINALKKANKFFNHNIQIKKLKTILLNGV